MEKLLIIMKYKISQSGINKLLIRKNNAIKLGLCLKCYCNPRYLHYTLCKKCFNTAKRNKKKLIIKRKNLELCKCGAERYEDKMSCFNCLQASKKYMNKLRSDPIRKKMLYKRTEIWRKNNPDKVYIIQKRSRDKNRKLVLDHYGRKCNCPGCDVTEEKFLSIDHINGGGSEHRKKIKRGGAGIYIWLIKNNFPDGFQILCHNCNLAKGFYGRCPHEERGVI